MTVADVWLQVGAQVAARLMMAEEHAAKFSSTDLVVVDRTNPLDEDNAAAFVNHAIAHCEGKDGATLRLRFVLDETAQAGDSKGRARVERMRRLLKEPMMGWCACHAPSSTSDMTFQAGRHRVDAALVVAFGLHDRERLPMPSPGHGCAVVLGPGAEQRVGAHIEHVTARASQETRRQASEEQVNHAGG